MTISDFENLAGSTEARWKYGGVAIVKKYPSFVAATMLSSGDGVVVVEPYVADPNNAVIYNADGSPRARLVNPCVADGAKCFDDVYYDGGELTVIARGPGFMWACVFDEQGRLLRTHETR